MNELKRPDFLAFAQPDLGEDEFAAVRRVLESGWVTTGPTTRQFEQEFARAVDARFAVAVNSCTAALHLSLEAIGLQRGDEVITTPYTFAATAEVIRYFDARPVFVDVDAQTLNLDPALLAAAVSPRTRAILPVHIAGLAADMDAIHRFARQHHLHVIEDAAHAFPASYRGRKIGSMSDLTCFSFYATKTITTGEGGMICTNHEGWAERCRIMALHGISRDAWKRYTAEGSWYYEIAAPGFKYNMTDLAAALGRVQLQRAEGIWARRRAIARRYQEAFSGRVTLQTPVEIDDRQHAWHLYLLRLNLAHLQIDRAAFIEGLKARNIGASVHFIPLHIHPYYRDNYGYRPEDFPIALREYQREISLPIYSKMTDGDVTSVIDAVLDVARKHERRSGAKRAAA